MLVKALIGHKWLPFALGAFGIASVYIAYRIDAKGYERGRSEIQALWDAEKLVQLQEYASLQSRYNEVTRQLKADAQAISRERLEVINEIEENHNSRVASLTAGNYKLRNEWQSCAADLSRASTTSSERELDDGASQDRLREEALRAVSGIGLEANLMLAERNSCLDTLETIYSRLGQ